MVFWDTNQGGSTIPLFLLPNSKVHKSDLLECCALCIIETTNWKDFVGMVLGMPKGLILYLKVCRRSHL